MHAHDRSSSTHKIIARIPDTVAVGTAHGACLSYCSIPL